MVQIYGVNFDVYEYNFDTAEFEVAFTSNMDRFSHTIDVIEVVYSSKGIYNNDGTTFFMNPPVQQGVVAQKLEEVEMLDPITTTLVGLAKLLIPLLICLLGFWKAWQLLLKILHKS